MFLFVELLILRNVANLVGRYDAYPVRSSQKTIAKTVSFPWRDATLQAQRPYLRMIFCWDFFEIYYKMTGSSAKLDQWNTSFVGILLGQTPAIGGKAATIAPLAET